MLGFNTAASFAPSPVAPFAEPGERERRNNEECLQQAMYFFFVGFRHLGECAVQVSLPLS